MVVPIIQVQEIFSGVGYIHEFALYISSHFARLDVSAILFQSLALDEKPQKERNAIVQRIARMEITTISSTRVNHFILFFSTPPYSLKFGILFESVS